MEKWNREKTLKILAIGNSFSDDALWLLPDILKSLGIRKFRVSNLYIGGCVLKTHSENIDSDAPAYEFRTNTGNGWETEFNTTLYTGLVADEWNFITFQQGSPDSGKRETYSYLAPVIDFVKKYRPSAKLGWQMTWAYQQDSNHGAFADYDCDQTTMYNAVVSAVKSEIATNKSIEFVVPNGTAIQNARTSYLGDTLTRDGFHMSYDIGRFITALSYARLITGYSLDEVTFAPDGVDENAKRVCIESVKNAIINPYLVTKSTYNAKP